VTPTCLDERFSARTNLYAAVLLLDREHGMHEDLLFIGSRSSSTARMKFSGEDIYSSDYSIWLIYAI
jgi:hypothetical protein